MIVAFPVSQTVLEFDFDVDFQVKDTTYSDLKFGFI
jgi:hypothetical protein